MIVEPHEERFCHWLSSYFFVAGYEREDLYQEARIAMWLAPEPALRRLCAYRRMVELLRHSQRRGRPTFWPLQDDAVSADVVDLLEARERLRSALQTPLTPLEQIALGRAVRGESCTEKRLDNALQRARKKLAA